MINSSSHSQNVQTDKEKNSTYWHSNFFDRLFKEYKHNTAHIS